MPLLSLNCVSGGRALPVPCPCSMQWGRGEQIKYIHRGAEVRLGLQSPSIVCPSLPFFLVQGGLKVGCSCGCFMLHEVMPHTHTHSRDIPYCRHQHLNTTAPRSTSGIALRVCPSERALMSWTKNCMALTTGTHPAQWTDSRIGPSPVGKSLSKIYLDIPGCWGQGAHLE